MKSRFFFPFVYFVSFVFRLFLPETGEPEKLKPFAFLAVQKEKL